MTAETDRAGIRCGPAGRLAHNLPAEMRRRRAAPLSRTTARNARPGSLGRAWRARYRAAQAVAERRGFPVSLGVFDDDQRGGEPHACDHTTTAVARCHPDARPGCARRDRRPVVGLGTAVVAAVAVWDVRPSGTALRPAAVAAVASPAVGANAGVAAVCAVAGVVPAVRRAGGAGAVGGGQQRVHGGIRGAGGVSGAGDRPDDGQSHVGDFVAGGREHRRADRVAAAGPGAARGAAAHRRRRVQLSQTASLSDGGRRSRQAAGGVGWQGTQRRDAGEVLRPAGTVRLRTDCVGDGGPGLELAESVAGKGAARRGGLRPVPRRTACRRRGRRGPASGATAPGRQGGQDAQGVALLPAETPGAAQARREGAAWRRYAARIVLSTAPTS